jgi:hypothetical protein
MEGLRLKQLAQLKLLRQHITTALKIPYAFALALCMLAFTVFFGNTEEECV